MSEKKKPSKCRQSNILETTNQILKGFVTRLSFSYLLPPVNHFQHRNGPNIVKSSVILEHHHHILVSAEHPEAPLGSCPHGVDCPKPPRFRQPLLQQRHTAKRSLPSPGGIKEVLIESQRILNIYINISYIYIYIYVIQYIILYIYIYQPVFGGQRFNTKCFLFGGRTPPCPNSWLYVRWMIWTTSPPSSADFPLRCCPRRRRRGPRSPHRPQPSLRRHHWRQQSESRPSWAKQNREIHWGDGIVIPCFNSFIISGVVMGRLKVDKIKMLTIVGMMF